MQFFTAAIYRYQAESFARRTTRYDVIAFSKTTRKALLFWWPRFNTSGIGLQNKSTVMT